MLALSESYCVFGIRVSHGRLAPENLIVRLRDVGSVCSAWSTNHLMNVRNRPASMLLASPPAPGGLRRGGAIVHETLHGDVDPAALGRYGEGHVAA